MLTSLFSHPLIVLFGFVLGAPVGAVFHAVLSTWIAKEEPVVKADVEKIVADAKKL